MSQVILNGINISYYWLPRAVFLAVLVVVLYMLIKRNSVSAFIALWGLRLSTGIVLTVALASSGAQYFIWKRDPFSQFLLPPHTSITYFLGYVETHFLRTALYALGSAVVVGLILMALKWYSKGRMVDLLDVRLGALGALMVGWPNVLMYVFVILLGASFWTIAGRLFSKGQPVYTPLTWFFPTVALLLLVGGDYAQPLVGLSSLRL